MRVVTGEQRRRIRIKDGKPNEEGFIDVGGKERTKEGKRERRNNEKKLL